MIGFFGNLPRRLARAVIYLAAASMASWSLFVVAHDIYGVPKALAVIVAAVFDGAALACLSLASDAVQESRSAAGPRLATLALAGVSVFLNVTHARHINGGLPAALLFAAPTIALLVVSDLSWAATRARVRAARGETPMTLPVFGAWGWMLAHSQAWQATKDKAVAHVTGGQTSPQEVSHDRRTDVEVVRDHFAGVGPVDAIRIAHDAHPELPPAALVDLLAEYGVDVEVLLVSLVLHQRRPMIEVERAEEGDAADAHHDAPKVGELPPGPKADAIRDAASLLGPDAPASDVVDLVAVRHNLSVGENYVRTVLSRDNRKPKPVDGVGQGGGGYA